MSRKSRAVAALSLFALLAGAAPAAAAVTATSVSNPTAGAALDGVAGTPITFTGTSDGAPGDEVALRCFRPDFPIESTAFAVGTVGAGGDWTASVDGADLPTGFCDLRAVPLSWFADDVTPYAATRVRVGSRQAPVHDTATGAALLTDFVIDELDAAAVTLASMGSCAVCASALVNDASIGQLGGQLWAGTGVLPGLEEDDGPARAGALVDGVRAYAPGSIAPGPAAIGVVFAPWGLNALPGFAPLQWTTSTAPDGTRTSVETQALMRCSGDPDALDGPSCAALAPTGVQVRRTVTIDPTATQIDIADRWTATDGRPHTLDLDWRQTLAPDTPRIKRGWDGEPFSATQAPRTVPGPGGDSAAATIYAAGAASPSTIAPQGAIVLAPAPEDVRFLPGSVVGSIANRLATRQLVDVPSHAPVTTHQVFLLGASRTAVEAAAVAAQERISAPEPGPVPENTTAPSLQPTSASTVSATLTASAGRWTQRPTSYDYQWLRCAADAPDRCAPITGATRTTYTLSGADVGARVRLQIVATNAQGVSDPARSTPTEPVTLAAPGASAPPGVELRVGTAGTSAVAVRGAWTGEPTAFTQQWLRCAAADPDACTPIPGAVKPTYRMALADAGAVLRVDVTAANPTGSTTARSIPDPPVQLTAPASLGPPTFALDAPAVSAVARRSVGPWGGEPVGYTQQWLRCDAATAEDCVAIAGATQGNYKLTTADAGRRVRVAVTATNGAGATTARSAASAVVELLAPVNAAAPKITPRTSGAATSWVGTTGRWTGEPTTLTVRWLRCGAADPDDCAPITGATATTHKPVAADAGHRLRLEVGATNAAGSALPARSDPSEVIAA